MDEMNKRNRECSLAWNPGAWVDFTAGRVPAGQAASMMEHAASCETCQREMAEQAAVWAALDEFVPPAVSPDFDARLYARIARAKDEGWTALFGRWLGSGWRPAMALSVVCAAVLMTVVVRAPQETRVPGMPPAVVEKAQAEPVDVETLEAALEDLEMLKLVDAGAAKI